VLKTFEYILRGIFKMAGFAPIREAMLGLDNKLRVHRPTPLPLERLTLSPSHGFILSRVDGSTTVSDVLSILPSDEDELASRFLFGLLVMGILEYDPPLGTGPFRVANILRDHADRRALERMQEQTIQQAYTQMRTQNPSDLLGVTTSASRDAIERAYEEAKALFSRERILPRVREKFRSELAVIESRLIEAYLTLTQAERRQAVQADTAEDATELDVEASDLLVRVEMDKSKSKLALEEAGKVADAYFAKARKAVREGDYHSAIQYGKLAISYNDGDARYYYVLAECQVRNPDAKWQRMAEQNYSKATELDPWNADYWISLGRFYKKRGLSIRARKQFEEALKLVPAHTVATKELESLG
jgi:tetratricopeptide (TPR) repeat protein